MASLVTRSVLQNFLSRKSTIFLKLAVSRPVFLQGTRQYHKRWEYPLMKDLYRRKLEQGPDPEVPRSDFVNWNYDAEVFAFGKRLGEDFTDNTLKTAFINESYVEKEKKRREELSLSDEAFSLSTNEELAKKGEDIAVQYVKAFLRHSYPKLPEEGICGITNYLMSDQILAYLGKNIGISDLILCEDFPPQEETISKSFKAVIGALYTDQGVERTELFIKDFIISHLIGKDINKFWEISDPMNLLSSILEKQGRGLPEPRLLRQSGTNTVLSVYVVGLYSDKQLIGQSPGETVLIAEEEAARDALQRMFGLDECRAPLEFDRRDRITLDYTKENNSISEYGLNIN